MSNSTLASLSLDSLKEAVEIKEQINKLQARLARLLGTSAVPEAAAKPAKARRGGRRNMSAAARARIAAAQRLRWAKLRAAKAAGSAKPAKAAKPAKPAKRKRNLSPAARKKLSDMMKARHAAKRAKQA